MCFKREVDDALVQVLGTMNQAGIIRGFRVSEWDLRRSAEEKFSKEINLKIAQLKQPSNYDTVAYFSDQANTAERNHSSMIQKFVDERFQQDTREEGLKLAHFITQEEKWKLDVTPFPPGSVKISIPSVTPETISVRVIMRRKVTEIQRRPASSRQMSEEMDMEQLAEDSQCHIKHFLFRNGAMSFQTWPTDNSIIIGDADMELVSAIGKLGGIEEIKMCE